MEKLLKFFTSRVFIVSALIFFQIALIALIMIFLSSIFIPIYVFFIFLNVIIVIVIINRNNNPMFKLAWIIPVLIFPVCGALFYLMFGRTHLNKKNTERLKSALGSADEFIKTDDELIERLAGKNSHIAREATYITRISKSNIYEFTETEYFSPGAEFFRKLLPELKKAKKFIFMEYFIVAEGKMWDEIRDILVDKVSRGVEVWFMYDDIGSISYVPLDFPTELRKLGFKVAVFNPYKPSLDKFLNYRDHRKFTIIDGKVAFTGGINIADEYIGKKTRFGVWNDSAIMLRGDAVNRITIMYLQIWYFATGELPDYAHYMADYRANHDGYVIPFSDEPLIQDLVCETAYINIIANARKYVYICTPYLILDNMMEAELIRAAQSGVDVHIITPAIPDKKLIFYMTQSYYPTLVEAGVKIHEYTPGFMHTKIIVSDDSTAIVGTANFDYRSFYLHFENGVWVHNSKAVVQARDSFLEALEASTLVTPEYIESISFWKKLLCSVLKAFAPLL